MASGIATDLLTQAAVINAVTVEFASKTINFIALAGSWSTDSLGRANLYAVQAMGTVINRIDSIGGLQRRLCQQAGQPYPGAIFWRDQ